VTTDRAQQLPITASYVSVGMLGMQQMATIPTTGKKKPSAARRAISRGVRS
jgi:hypothetical protein